MHTAVRRLAVARLVSEAGTFAAIFVGIWGKPVFRFHATPGQMAVQAAVTGVTAIVGSLAAGVLVDRYDPKRVLIGAEIIAVPSVLALMIPESIWPFVAVAGLASFAGGVIMASVASFAPFVTEGEALRRGNVSIEIASSLAMVVGPAAGGFIAKAWSIDAVFVFDVLTSLAALALLAPMRVRALERSERTRALAELREGVRFAAGHRPVRLYLIAGACVWTSFGAFSSLEALFYREVLHSGPALVGWVLSLFGVALLTGALLIQRVPKRWLNARGALVLVGLIGCGEIVYVVTGNLAVVIAGNTLWGLAMGAMWPMLRTLIQTATPERLVGRVMGSSVTLNRGGQLLPLAFVGALAAAFGVQRVLVGSGALLAVVALALRREARAVDAAVARAPDALVAEPALAERASHGVV